MSPTPLVSIITPSYNQAAFLEQTIESVLNQDYPNIEYMIVDGGSTDGSLEIIRRHADRLAWWVSEPDSGQAEAINKGLQRVFTAKTGGSSPTCEIVAWLNSDDIYLPGAISQAVEVFESNPELGLVFGDAIAIDAQGKPLSRFAFEDWGLLDLISFRIICQPAVFMRRSALEKAGLLEPSFHFMLDHHLWIRIARISSIQHVPAKLASADGRHCEERPVQSEAKESNLGCHCEERSNPGRGLWAAARHHSAAKNVSQAAGFGRETLQVLEWMKTQPDLAALIQANRRRVLAGAYRLNARYLLDEGLAAKALISYGRSLAYRPSFALKHWHRMLYAFAALFRLENLTLPFVNRVFAQQREQLKTVLRETDASVGDKRYPLAEWPGLDLDV